MRREQDGTLCILYSKLDLIRAGKISRSFCPHVTSRVSLLRVLHNLPTDKVLVELFGMMLIPILVVDSIV